MIQHPFFHFPGTVPKDHSKLSTSERLVFRRSSWRRWKDTIDIEFRRKTEENRKASLRRHNGSAWQYSDRFFAYLWEITTTCFHQGGQGWVVSVFVGPLLWMLVVKRFAGNVMMHNKSEAFEDDINGNLEHPQWSQRRPFFVRRYDTSFSSGEEA